MKNNTQLKLALCGLAKLQIALEKKGGPEADGSLFEQIIEVIEGILKSFGLPPTSDNEGFLWFPEIPTEYELEEIINLLHKTATEYLLSKPKPELQVLRDAQEQKSDPFIVLPELKIPTHTYTFFVYNKMLLKRKDTVENVLQELKFVNENGYLGALGRIGQNQEENHSQLIDYLSRKGVRYINQFMISNSDLLTDDDY